MSGLWLKPLTRLHVDIVIGDRGLRLFDPIELIPRL